MIRFFFVLIAVVAAVLAFLVQSLWLTGLAGVAVVVAVVLLIQDMRRARRQEAPYAYEPHSREEELEELGIVNVRERKAKAPVPDEGRTATAGAPAQATPKRTSEKNGKAPASERMPTGGEDEQEKHEASEPLSPLLEGLRTALGAHTACLLSQEELALEYRIEAIAGPERYLDAGRTFPTSAPLLTAGMSQQDVAFQSVGPEGITPECLGYYAGESPVVQQVALAPLARAGDPTTWFLTVDALNDDLASSRAARTLLPRFADLLALMLDLHDAPDAQDAVGRTEAAGATSGPEEAPRPMPAGDGAASGEPRPRREIIAEEMERARTEGRNLALALVYLNRAETLAARGPEAVAAAEAALRDRLERTLPHGRVERFGELTYGVFRHGSVEEVEAWAIDLERDFARADAPLEGGVSVGLAVLQESHHADAFRADATKALHEAYTTGTCTILA